MEREREELQMRRDTRQRKRAFAELRAISGQDRMVGAPVHVISFGKQAINTAVLGLMAPESVVLIEREELEP